MSDYNGWTNYETWSVKLWMDNDQGSQEYWLEAARDTLESAEGNQYSSREDVARYNLADRLKSEHMDAMPEVEGVFSDLLAAALGSVNWYEIAESLLGEAKEILGEDDEDA